MARNQTASAQRMQQIDTGRERRSNAAGGSDCSTAWSTQWTPSTCCETTPVSIAHARSSPMRRHAAPVRLSSKDKGGDAFQLPSICSKPPALGAIETATLWTAAESIGSRSTNHLRTIVRQKGSKPSAASTLVSHTSPRSGVHLAPLDRFMPRYDVPAVHNYSHNQRSNNHEEEAVLKQIWLAATASATVQGHKADVARSITESNQRHHEPAVEIRCSRPVHSMDEEVATVGTTLARYRRLVGMQARKTLLRIVRVAAQNVAQCRREDAAARTIHTAARRFLGRRRRARIKFEMVDAVERAQRVWRGWRGRKEGWRRREEQRKRTEAAKALQEWWMETRRREEEKRRKADAAKRRSEQRRLQEEEKRRIVRRAIGRWAGRRREAQNSDAGEVDAAMSKDQNPTNSVAVLTEDLAEREDVEGDKSATKKPQCRLLAVDDCQFDTVGSCEVETAFRDSTCVKRQQHGTSTGVEADEQHTCSSGVYATEVVSREIAERTRRIAVDLATIVDDDVVMKCDGLTSACGSVTRPVTPRQTLPANTISVYANPGTWDPDSIATGDYLVESEVVIETQLNSDSEGYPVFDGFLTAALIGKQHPNEGCATATRHAGSKRSYDVLKRFLRTRCVPHVRMTIRQRHSAAIRIQQLVRKYFAYKEVAFSRQLHLVSLRSELQGDWKSTSASLWTLILGEEIETPTASEKEERALEDEDDELENWFDGDAVVPHGSTDTMPWNEVLPTRSGAFPQGIRLPLRRDRSMKTSNQVPSIGLWRWNWQSERWEPHQEHFNLSQSPTAITSPE